MDHLFPITPATARALCIDPYTSELVVDTVDDCFQGVSALARCAYWLDPMSVLARFVYDPESGRIEAHNELTQVYCLDATADSATAWQEF